MLETYCYSTKHCALRLRLGSQKCCQQCRQKPSLIRQFLFLRGHGGAILEKILRSFAQPAPPEDPEKRRGQGRADDLEARIGHAVHESALHEGRGCVQSERDGWVERAPRDATDRRPYPASSLEVEASRKSFLSKPVARGDTTSEVQNANLHHNNVFLARFFKMFQESVQISVDNILSQRDSFF